MRYWTSSCGPKAPLSTPPVASRDTSPVGINAGMGIARNPAHYPRPHAGTLNLAYFSHHVAGYCPGTWLNIRVIAVGYWRYWHVRSVGPRSSIGRLGGVFRLFGRVAPCSHIFGRVARSGCGSLMSWRIWRRRVSVSLSCIVCTEPRYWRASRFITCMRRTTEQHGSRARLRRVHYPLTSLNGWLDGDLLISARLAGIHVSHG